MIIDVSVAMTWILFIALFPMAFFWLRAAWRIQIKRDFSEVALKRGEPPPNPEKYAPYAMGINLLAGGIALGVIIAVLFTQTPYETWTAIAGSTLWGKFIANFILSRQAHLNLTKKNA